MFCAKFVSNCAAAFSSIVTLGSSGFVPGPTGPLLTVIPGGGAFVGRLNVGGWFTNCTVIVNVCGALVFWPPLAVPPLSTAITVTVATPFELAVGVNVNVPVGLMAGCTANRALLLLLTMSVTDCAASSGGPGLMFVRKPLNELRPLFSNTATFVPSVNEGGWFTGMIV